MELGRTYYARTRAQWRRWLARNHSRAKEIWLVHPRKHTGRPSLPYNDAVEEALCYGWIDSNRKSIDEDRYAQRFTPRRPGSPLSAMNRERVRRLIAARRMTRAGLRAIDGQLAASRGVTMAPDVLAALERGGALAHFRRFPASYRRIRVAWIEGARRRPDEFRKRLAYFVRMTARNQTFGMLR